MQHNDFTEYIFKIVSSYLRRSNLNVEVNENNYRLVEGSLNIDMVSNALADGAVCIEEDGSISFCGESIQSGWDTNRIRRRLEDHLQKSASASEIIRTAFSLGVKIRG